MARFSVIPPLPPFLKGRITMKTAKRIRRRLPALLYSMMVLCGALSACTVLTGPGGDRESAGESLPTFTAATEPADTLPPVIAGVHDWVIYQGDDLPLGEGVTVTDDTDPSPRLEMDVSALDADTPGEYTVLYCAYDRANNPAIEEATVTVLEKKEGYASMEQIEEMADKLLSQIVTEDMDPAGQIQAIYDWARASISYTGHSDKSDWYQAAWAAMTGRTGDCFSYFALCKMFFGRLGIANIDVVKVRNSEEDSDHFWSMVSIDGGESWYHFDATPRIGGGDFCMVTDSYLDEYSQAHKGSHNRDKSLYPATPEK